MRDNIFLKAVFIAFLSILSASNCISQLDLSAFEGKWKLEGKDSFEEWVMVSPDSLSGKGYMLVDGQERISEYLALYGVDEFYYSARVLNQNEGNTIAFKWKGTEDNCELFENPGHDFPQRIKYCFKEGDILNVFVSDMEGNGFQIVLRRVEK